MRETELADHAQLLAVGPSAPHQIAHLEASGFEAPLLLDPDDRLRSLVGATSSFGWRAVANPRAAAVYWRALRQAEHSDADWSRLRARPAFIVTDAELNVTWSYVGQKLADYPSVADVVAAAKRAA